MESETQYKIYKAVLDLMDNGVLKGDVSKEMYVQLIGSLRADLVSQKEADRESALQMLEILLLNHVFNIQEDVVDMLKIADLRSNVRDYLLQCVKSYILDLLMTCKVKAMASVYTKLTAIDPAKFCTILRQIFDLPRNQEYCKTYLFKTLVDVIFDEHCQDPDILDMASNIASVVPVSSMPKELQKSFFVDLKRRLYAIFLLNDEAMNYKLTISYWEKRWIFLIRLLREHLTGQIDLLNKLLSVVECVFRSTYSEQKLKGFDCWKEFISVLSFDRKNFITEKHIQLMVRPLKAKFSQHSALIIRKFELFLYLMEKLQDKATLVLKDFLAFCYGSFKTVNPNRGQIRGVPELWLKGACVFLILIGHSHESNQICLGTTDILTLKSPVITVKDLAVMYKELLISAGQCCKMLKQVELGNNRVNVLKCIWKSLLKSLLKDDSAEVPNCNGVVQDLLNHLMEDRFFWSELITVILNVILDVDSEKAAHLFLCCVSEFMDFIFSVSLDDDSTMVYTFIQTMKKFENQIFAAQVVPCIFQNFSKYKASEVNTGLVADIWMYVADATEAGLRAEQLDFLMWPLLHSHQISDKTKRERLYGYFEKGIHSVASRNNAMLLEIYKQLRTILQNNPLYSEVVTRFVMLFEPQPDQKDVTGSVVEIIRLLLLIPPGNTDRKKKCLQIQMYFNELFKTKNFSKIEDKEVISNIQFCVEQLVRCGYYGLLDYTEILDKLPGDIKRLHAETFPTNNWLEIYRIEKIRKSTKIKQKVEKLIEAMKAYKSNEKNGNDDVWPVKVNVVHETPSGKVEPAKPTFKLLGLDADMLSPVKVAGSQLKNVATSTAAARSSSAKAKYSSRTPKKETHPFIDEDANSEFVFVPSAVQLDKTKMTEHQKEILAKRRDDIPALYQDLTQSVSHSLTESTNSAPSKDNPTESGTSTLESDNTSLMSELKRLTMDVVGAEDFMAVESKLRHRSNIVYSPKPISLNVKINSSGSGGRKSKRKSTPVQKFSPSNIHQPSKKMPKVEKVSEVDEDIIENSQKETTMLSLKFNRSASNNSKTKNENAASSREVAGCTSATAEKRQMLPLTELTGDVNISIPNLRSRPKKLSKIDPCTAVLKNVKVQEGGKVKSSSTKTLDQSNLEHNYCIVNSTSESADGFCKEVEDLMNGPRQGKTSPLTSRSLSAPPVVEHSSRRKAPERKQPGRQTPVIGHKIVEKNNTPVCKNPMKSNKASSAIKTKPTRSSPRFQSKIDVSTGTLGEHKEIQHDTLDDLNLLERKKLASASYIQSEVNNSSSNVKQNTESQETETQGTEPLEISKGDEQLQLDLPVKVPFTDADREFAVRDTATLTASDIMDTENFDKTANEPDTMTEIIESTEDQSIHKAITTCKKVIIELERVSPTTSDNNNDIQDVSQTQLLSSPVSGETPNKINEFLNNTSDISPIGSQESSNEKRCTLVPVTLQFDSEDEQQTQPSSSDNDKDHTQNTDDVFIENNEGVTESSQSKPSKFTCLKSPAIQRFSTRRKFGFNTSPSVSRIEKLMSNLKPACEPEQSSDERQEDILTFSREVPSSKAKPKCGILKRKHPDFNEESGLSPCSKRKRVNFSDPCTTSRKIFIKDDGTAVNQKLVDELEKECQELLGTPQESTDSSNTEGSMDPHDDVTLMGGDDPICPNLSQCEDDIQVISKALVDAECEDEVLKKLHEHDIKRVGDLARLSTGAILQLRIDGLSVTKVFDVLWEYCDKIVNSKTQTPDNATNGSVEKSSAMSIFNEICEELTDTEIGIAMVKLGNIIISRQRSPKDSC